MNAGPPNNAVQSSHQVMRFPTISVNDRADTYHRRLSGCQHHCWSGVSLPSSTNYKSCDATSQVVVGQARLRNRSRPPIADNAVRSHIGPSNSRHGVELRYGALRYFSVRNPRFSLFGAPDTAILNPHLPFGRNRLCILRSCVRVGWRGR